MEIGNAAFHFCYLHTRQESAQQVTNNVCQIGHIYVTQVAKNGFWVVILGY